MLRRAVQQNRYMTISLPADGQTSLSAAGAQSDFARPKQRFLNTLTRLLLNSKENSSSDNGRRFGESNIAERNLFYFKRALVLAAGIRLLFSLSLISSAARF